MPAGVAFSSKRIDAAAPPLGRKQQHCAQLAGRGAAAAGWHEMRAQGDEGMVAGGQGPGSWATASACLRGLAGQPASQNPEMGGA